MTEFRTASRQHLLVECADLTATMRLHHSLEIAALPGVDSAGADETDDRRVRAVCTDSDAALAALFTGPLASEVHDVLVAAPGLEEAFLRITEHEDEEHG